MIRIFSLALAIFVLSHTLPAHAGPEDFKTGPVIEDFGPTAKIDTDMDIPEDASFKILFDTSKGAKAGELNRTLTTAARFVNMHAAAGVPVETMELAIVVHGSASFDLVKDAAYTKKYEGTTNDNAALIAALTKTNIRIILCGQSAAYHGIAKDDLLPNVEMALSAMTANALLQQDGYTLNPF